jgi:hypothetical protein
MQHSCIIENQGIKRKTGMDNLGEISAEKRHQKLKGTKVNLTIFNT